jgi:hypothetical protein
MPRYQEFNNNLTKKEKEEQKRRVEEEKKKKKEAKGCKGYNSFSYIALHFSHINISCFSILQCFVTPDVLSSI